jgi:ABC-type nitrate/sulfonate/bicarbonate transport system substrate-binding protein
MSGMRSSKAKENAKIPINSAGVAKLGGPTFVAWMTRKDFADKHPDVVKAFTKVTLDTYDDFRKHPEGGPAGAWAAIMAAERGASVVLADKGRVGTSGATAAANTAVIDVAPGSVARRQVIERRLERRLGLAQAEWIERRSTRLVRG